MHSGLHHEDSAAGPGNLTGEMSPRHTLSQPCRRRLALTTSGRPAHPTPPFIPDGLEPSSPGCKPGVVAAEPRNAGSPCSCHNVVRLFCQWTHRESHPDHRLARPGSSCWTMSPFRIPTRTDPGRNLSAEAVGPEPARRPRHPRHSTLVSPSGSHPPAIDSLFSFLPKRPGNMMPPPSSGKKSIPCARPFRVMSSTAEDRASPIRQ